MIQPLHDQVFLVRVKPPETTSSGLHIPESAAGKGFECRVLAAGPGRTNPDTGARLPMSVAAGDFCILAKYQGAEIDVPGAVRESWGIGDRDAVLVVRETEILAVVKRAS